MPNPNQVAATRAANEHVRRVAREQGIPPGHVYDERNREIYQSVEMGITLKSIAEKHNLSREMIRIIHIRWTRYIEQGKLDPATLKRRK